MIDLLPPRRVNPARCDALLPPPPRHRARRRGVPVRRRAARRLDGRGRAAAARSHRRRASRAPRRRALARRVRRRRPPLPRHLRPHRRPRAARRPAGRLRRARDRPRLAARAPARANRARLDPARGRAGRPGARRARPPRDRRPRRGDAGRAGFRRGGRAALMAERGSSGWRARLRVAGLGPGALPPGMRGGAARLAEGSLSVDAEAEAPADLSRAVAQVRAEIEGLVLAGERIGPQPVGPLSASAAGTLEWDRAARRVTLRDGAATLLKSLAASVSGELALGPPATFSVALRADRLDYSALLAALPPALAVPPGAPRPSGTLDGRLEVGGPLLAPAEWTLSAALELGRIRDAARHGGRTSLAEPFLHRPPLDAGGRGRELVVGPANPNFVPIGELPEHVIRAVTTAEDGGFFGHAGFDFDELRNAFAQGAEKGRVVRGGSTISQQLAKNLFLASCWEIVEPPRTTRPFSAPCANAFRSSSKSNPAWPKKPPSSAVVTARMTCSGSSPMGTKFGFAGPTTSSRPRPPASSGGLWRNGSASDVRPPWRAASRIRPSSSAAESVHSAGARSGPPTSSRPSSVPEGRGAPGGTASAGGSAASRAE